MIILNSLWQWLISSPEAAGIIAIIYTFGRDVWIWISKIIYRKTSKIKIIPNDFMNLYYDKNRFSISLYTTLLSSKADIVVSKMSIVIIDNRKEVYRLEWDNFKPTTHESFSANSSMKLSIYMNKSEFTPRHPFNLFKGHPRLLHIGFFVKDESDKKANTIKLEAKEYKIVFEVETVMNRTYIHEKIMLLNDKNIINLKNQRADKFNGKSYEQVLVNLQDQNKISFSLYNWIKKYLFVKR